MRQFDTTSGLTGGIFPDPASASRTLDALRKAGFSAHYLGRDEAPHVVAQKAPARPPVLKAGAIGAAAAVVIEATVLGLPAWVPTIMDGQLIAAALGGAAGAALALMGPAMVVRPDEPGMMDELVQGRSAVMVNARGRLRRERARQMLRQHGATRLIEMAGDEQVDFATPFAVVTPSLRADSEKRFGRGKWDEYEPAYLFGWDRANRPDLDESSWQDAAAELERDWSVRYPDRAWSEVEDAVRASWDKAHALTDEDVQ